MPLSEETVTVAGTWKKTQKSLWLSKAWYRGIVINVITDVVERVKSRRRYSSRQLHHIVAQRDQRAAYTRIILARNDLHVWSVYNLVLIENSLHRYLHTNAYFAGVGIHLRQCEAKKRTKTERRYAVIAGLLTIGSAWRAASSSL